MSLNWPRETAVAAPEAFCWQHPESNICLDFHGDPRRARLVVFSDGNHHMALHESLRLYLTRHEEVQDVFYVTTPPPVLLEALKRGGVSIGNLQVSVTPHVFISPPAVLEQLVSLGYMNGHRPFMRSRGNVLLVRHGNPKRIEGVADLAREDVRLFLSNPHTERASNEVYVASLKALAAEIGIELDFLDADGGTNFSQRICFGQRIHHREAPQALVDGRADVAMIYYHLALRYVRIFPGVFDIIPLGGKALDPQPAPGNAISTFHAGIVGDGGDWGASLLDFLMDHEVGMIYRQHGLARPDE